MSAVFPLNKKRILVTVLLALLFTPVTAFFVHAHKEGQANNCYAPPPNPNLPLRYNVGCDLAYRIVKDFGFPFVFYDYDSWAFQKSFQNFRLVPFLLNFLLHLPLGYAIVRLLELLRSFTRRKQRVWVVFGACLYYAFWSLLVIAGILSGTVLWRIIFK